MLLCIWKRESYQEGVKMAPYKKYLINKLEENELNGCLAGSFGCPEDEFDYDGMYDALRGRVDRGLISYEKAISLSVKEVLEFLSNGRLPKKMDAHG